MTLRGVIVSFIMTIVLSIMVLGYAALQQRIDIEGQADIDSTYRVEITRVQEGTAVGDARSTNAPQYNGLNASFYVGLTNTTDSITYTIEITNYSTVDVRLNNLELSTTNNNMKVSKIGISNGDIMLAGSTKTFTVKIKLETATSSEQISTITVSPDFTRLKGGAGSVVEEVYTAYEIGDVVSFAGSNWYVIEDSTNSQDYVVLLKETALTSDELTQNYRIMINDTIQNKMAYYWSDTCHLGSSSQTYYYGQDGPYTTTDNSGCRSAVKTYDESKAKEFLDSVYVNKLNTSNLKEVDGYKLRLLSLSELVEKFDYSKVTSTQYDKGSNTPAFIYSDQYMISNSSEYASYYLWYMNTTGKCRGNNGVYVTGKIRPVINLYKSAID